MAKTSDAYWIRIGEQMGVDQMDIEAKEWVRGCQHELEHWKTVDGNPRMIAGIALDHLREDKDYYKKLEKLNV